MKRMMIATVTFLIPCLAFAQQGNGQFELRLPPTMQQCIDMMCNGQPKPAAAKKPDKPEPPKVKVRKGPSIVKLYGKRITVLETRVLKLRQTVEGLLAKSDRSDRDAEVASIKAELRALRKQITEVSAMLGENSNFDARGLAALNKRIDNLKEALGGLGGSNVKFGPSAGFLAYKASDGTGYTTSLLGADLQLKLSWRWDLRIGAAVLVSGGERHFGTAVRAGLDFNFSRLVFLDFGLNGVWAGMSSKLHASNAVAAADIGFGLKWKFLRVSVNFMLGPEFDKDSPSLATGGFASLGLALP